MLSEGLSIGKILTEKKYGGMGLISEKTGALYVELKKRAEAVTSGYSAPGNFSEYIYSVLVAKNQMKIRSRCLVHEFSFADINHGKIFISSYIKEKLFVAASALFLSSTYKASVFPEIKPASSYFFHLNSFLWKGPLTFKVRKIYRSDFELHQVLF